MDDTAESSTQITQDPAVFEYQGSKCVKCEDCRTIYRAIGARCPNCKSEEVVR